MRHFGPGGVDAGWHIAVMVIWVLTLVAIVVIGVLVARRLTANPTTPPVPYGPPRSAAIEELDLRYARGELGRDEYLARRSDLMWSAAGPSHPPFAAAHLPPAPPAAPPPGASPESPPPQG